MKDYQDTLVVFLCSLVEDPMTQKGALGFTGRGPPDLQGPFGGGPPGPPAPSGGGS